MLIDRQVVDEIRSRADITEIIGSYVTLRRAGSNFSGLCPFHNEKTPSFFVFNNTETYHCFGCGAGGDVITFIRKIENLDYIEAVKMLADRVGLQMPEQGVDDSMSRLRQRVLEINRESARFFHNALLSPEVNHLRSKGYSEREMIAANVAVETRSGRAMDRFHARVMFPIIDLRGNVVAFGGRILTNEKPKYINTSDTPVYHKSSGLFAMNFAKNALENDRIILAEGYMDVISLHKAGIENAIASLGTALTAEQARIIPILRGAGLLVRVMAVPGNKDPDEFINACGDEGAARFRRLIEQSGNDVEYRLAKLKSGYDLSNENGRIQYLMAAVELLAGLENAIERDVYVSRLSQELNVDKNAILQQMSVSVRKKARAAQRQQQRDMTEQLSARRDTVNPEKRRYVRVANAEERLIACLFHNNDLAQSLNRRVPPEKFVTAFNRRLYQSLLGKIINEETVTSPQITDFSAECTPDEMGRLAKIVQENAGITAKDAEEYVQIILSEGALTDTDKVRGANPADLQAQLDALRKQKK